MDHLFSVSANAFLPPPVAAFPTALPPVPGKKALLTPQGRCGKSTCVAPEVFYDEVGGRLVTGQSPCVLMTCSKECTGLNASIFLSYHSV